MQIDEDTTAADVVAYVKENAPKSVNLGSEQDVSDAARGPIRLSVGRSRCGAMREARCCSGRDSRCGERRGPVLTATQVALVCATMRS
jgi:hypothetical protein